MASDFLRGKSGCLSFDSVSASSNYGIERLVRLHLQVLEFADCRLQVLYAKAA
jgi:hypothetical protein